MESIEEIAPRVCQLRTLLRCSCVSALLTTLLLTRTVLADDRGFHFELGHEYSDFKKTSPGSSSGGKGGGASFWRRAALYLPNRVLDLLDIVKCDLGIGVGYGAVVRPTKYLQFGYREMEPGMLRAGLLGRRAPFLIEERDEFGFGSELSRGTRRKISPGEVGVGVDLGVIGAYGGLSLDSTADFVLGIFGVDFEDDDLE